MATCARARRSRPGERERIREFVCQTHVESSGCPYWRNTVTSETTWDKPASAETSSYEFVCETQSRVRQTADLSEDFPELFDDALWQAQACCSWVVEDDVIDEAAHEDGATGLSSSAREIRGGQTKIIAAVGLSCGTKADDFRTGKITYLYVDGCARRRGLGRGLLRLASAEAEDRGITELRLLTLRGVFDAALALYESESWVVESEESVLPYQLVRMFRSM